jgi:hypothetical protein
VDPPGNFLLKILTPPPPDFGKYLSNHPWIFNRVHLCFQYIKRHEGQLIKSPLFQLIKVKVLKKVLIK